MLMVSSLALACVVADVVVVAVIALNVVVASALAAAVLVGFVPVVDIAVAFDLLLWWWLTLSLVLSCSLL